MRLLTKIHYFVRLKCFLRGTVDAWWEGGKERKASRDKEALTECSVV